MIRLLVKGNCDEVSHELESRGITFQEMHPHRYMREQPEFIITVGDQHNDKVCEWYAASPRECPKGGYAAGTLLFYTYKSEED